MADRYTIQVGDTLESIAADHYGNRNMWQKIFNANTQRLKNPDQLNPGEQIIIPD